MGFSIRLLAAGIVVSFLCSSDLARLEAQVVQLPSVGYFSYSGSVLAPDSGSGYLGGSSSTRAYSSQSGRPRSQRLGGHATSGNASVHAHVIDLNEIDRQIRGLAPTSDAAPSKSRLPARTTKRSVNGISSPVADIYTRPLKDEVNTPRQLQRRRTIHDFTPGDYMLLMSHPGIVQHADAAAPAVTSETPSSTVAKAKK